MRSSKVGRVTLAVLGVALAAALAFGAGRLVGSLAPNLGPASASAQETSEEPTAQEPAPWEGPWAEAVKITVEDQEFGRLEIGGVEVLTVQTSAGGLSAYERCGIVAMRINDALRDGFPPIAFTSDVINGMAVVNVEDRIIITVDDAQAGIMGMTTPQVAAQWAQAIVAAFATPPPTTDEPGGEEAEAVGEEETGEQAAPPAEEEPVGEAEWTPPEPYDDKFVPVLSALEGIKLGVARVNGPKSELSKVQAVVQLETHFKELLEIDVYVPISTKVPGKTLARVQGVAVTGLVDIKL